MEDGQELLELDEQSGTTTMEIDDASHQPRSVAHNARIVAGGFPDGRQRTTRRDDPVQPEVSNLLVPERPAYISETSGKLRYLGHSSNYAFTQQVLQMLNRDSPANPSPEILLSSDGKVYEAESNRLMPLKPPDINGLPSKRIALHYLQCVQFRTQPLFYLFDEADFRVHLNLFYDDPLTYAQSAVVWYTHYLVLMAIGRALDSRIQRGTSSDVIVLEHFTRALQLLPDMAYLCDHSVETTELFCCIALYLQSIDHRRAAIVYVSCSLGCVCATD